MGTLYGRQYARKELLERVGDISQLAGIKKVCLANGNENGVEAFIVRTGSGLNFTVLASRCLDISSADWCGLSLSWTSTTGDVAPRFYEEPGMGWLRSFFGGLMVTCGLTYAGSPCVDQGRELGLHGRISNTPGHNICHDCEWQGDDYLMWISGKMRETTLFGENVLLTRRISAKLGESSIGIEDTVQNQGYETIPHMILYHINAGFPVVDDGAELIAPTISVQPYDEESTKEMDLHHKFGPPTPGWKQRAYYHDMACDDDGVVITALVNRNISGGFGLYVKYSKKELPMFAEWKMMGLGAYVVGMEPCNCHAEGRAREREYGTLQMLEPGEARNYRLEIGALTSEEAVSNIERRVAGIKGGAV